MHFDMKLCNYGGAASEPSPWFQGRQLTELMAAAEWSLEWNPSEPPSLARPLCFIKMSEETAFNVEVAQVGEATGTLAHSTKIWVSATQLCDPSADTGGVGTKPFNTLQLRSSALALTLKKYIRGKRK